MLHCKFCDKTFTPKPRGRNATFCCDQCRIDFNNALMIKLRRAWREHERRDAKGERELMRNGPT